MCLNNYFQRKLELMAPDERIMLSRKDLEYLLAQYASCSPAQEEKSRSADAARKNTASLAEHFGRSESTVRGWIKEGRFGDPESLKPNGRDYEIPRVAVERVDRMLDEGKRFLGGQWQSPAQPANGTPVPFVPSTGGAPSHQRPLSQMAHSRNAPLSAASGPKPTKVVARPRNTVGKYGGWRSA